MQRQSTYMTSFPPGAVSLNSTLTSERMGAFGTMQLDQPSPGPSNFSRISTPQSNPQSRMSHHGSTPILYQHPPKSVASDARSVGTVRHTYIPLRTNNRKNDVYQTTVSNADTSDTRRKYDNLSEVYTMSGDTVEFARNLGEYLREKIPYVVSVTLLGFLCILAFVCALIGCLNIPFCQLQPMIPIWLIVAGFLFIVSAIFRIYNLIPSPPSRTKNLSLDLCVKGIEVLFVIANIVWLILGCVWVYGNKSFVHFEETFFQSHYCDGVVYWTAFVAVTGYLALICILILGLIVLLCVGSYKEAVPRGVSLER